MLSNIGFGTVSFLFVIIITNILIEKTDAQDKSLALAPENGKELSLAGKELAARG